jgi:hypothetical protein
MRRLLPPARDPSPSIPFWDVARHVVHMNIEVLRVCACVSQHRRVALVVLVFPGCVAAGVCEEQRHSTASVRRAD